MEININHFFLVTTPLISINIPIKIVIINAKTVTYSTPPVNNVIIELITLPPESTVLLDIVCESLDNALLVAVSNKQRQLLFPFI